MGFLYQGEVIVSRQNRRVVDLCKLEDRKARQAQKRFRFDGIKLLCEAVERNVPLEAIFLKQGGADKVEARFEELTGRTPSSVSCPAFLLSDELFDKISQENAPEGVICVAGYIDRIHKMYIIEKEVTLDLPEGPILLLESVRDPLNVGAIIRSAAALGIKHLVISEDCADLYHPKTLRAAMGPLFSMPITRVDNLTVAVEKITASGRRVFAAALDDTAVKLGEFSFRFGDCVIIGNEGHGLSEGVIKACTRSIYIPMQAGTESLNAGVAAALLMWELCK
ncbi:MAG: RNA methyltransferase [Ruminococcaceae bacterium]|nr:RNA methyltransferase [Oscillospiraceae bacterium]